MRPVVLRRAYTRGWRPPRAHSEPQGHRSRIVPSSGTGQRKETPWSLLGGKSGSSQERDAAAPSPLLLSCVPPPITTRQAAGRSAWSGLRKSNSDHPSARFVSRGSSPLPPKASSSAPPLPASLSSCIPRWARTEQSFQKTGGVEQEEPSQGREARRGEQGQDQDQHPGLLHLAELEALPQVPRLRGEKKQSRVKAQGHGQSQVERHRPGKN